MTSKILILEDVPFDVELIEREISQSGIDFLSKTVELEEDYVRLIDEFKPDLILADHSLPNFDGISALEIAKNKCPEIPFIFVSGKIGEEFAVEALKRGVTDYVLKSNLSKLGPAIKRAMIEVQEQIKLKKAEEELLKSHWQLKEAQKIGKMGSWEFDIQSEDMDASEGLFRIFGVEKIEQDLNFSRFLDFIYPADKKRVSDTIQEALKNKSSFSQEYRILLPDGSLRYLYSQGKIINDTSGKPLKILGIEQDITQRKLDENKIKESLKEKEILLQEIHHRVKNNLQVISSLLRLQSRFIKDPEALEIFKESQNRVSSIALVHEKLYHSPDLASINFSEYIRNLSKDIFHFFHSKAQNIKLKLELDEIFLNIETAIPCGLIINELVTNSLKHAFLPEQKGEITLKLFKDGDKITLIVKDNGRGLPPGIEVNNTETFGLQLVYFLNKRINGVIKLNTSQGTSFKICFEELNYEGRASNGE